MEIEINKLEDGYKYIRHEGNNSYSYHTTPINTYKHMLTENLYFITDNHFRHDCCSAILCILFAPTISLFIVLTLCHILSLIFS